MGDGGLIEYFNLEEWYNTLTKKEKQKLREYYFAPVGIGITISVQPSNPQEDPSIIELGNPIKHINSRRPKLTKLSFLQLIGNNAIYFEDYSFAQKTLIEALEDKDIDVISRHFILNSLIILFYRKRHEESNALEKCIKYCDEDIKFLNDFLNAYKNGEKLEKERTIYDDSPVRTLTQDDAERMKEIFTLSNNVSALIRDYAEKTITVKHLKNLANEIKDSKQPLSIQVTKNVYKTESKYNGLSEDIYKQAEELEKSLSIIYEKQGKIKIYIPSVERLAIIYEKQGKIKEAIEICEIGMKYELRDSTAGGFEKRKERLEKKLTKPKINLYEKEKKRPKIKKEKIDRPIIPYKKIDLNFDININFSASNSSFINNDHVGYWNQFVKKLFNLINDIAQREIAFLDNRKNYPLPIVTTYQRCKSNPINSTDKINLDLEVFTDENCSKFVDDLYNILKSIRPCNEILSFDVKQPWLLSISKDGINRTHFEIKCKIRK